VLCFVIQLLCFTEAGDDDDIIISRTVKHSEPSVTQQADGYNLNIYYYTKALKLWHFLFFTYLTKYFKYFPNNS